MKVFSDQLKRSKEQFLRLLGQVSGFCEVEIQREIRRYSVTCCMNGGRCFVTFYTKITLMEISNVDSMESNRKYIASSIFQSFECI